MQRLQGYPLQGQAPSGTRLTPIFPHFHSHRETRLRLGRPPEGALPWILNSGLSRRAAGGCRMPSTCFPSHGANLPCLTSSRCNLPHGSHCPHLLAATPLRLRLRVKICRSSGEGQTPGHPQGIGPKATQGTGPKARQEAGRWVEGGGIKVAGLPQQSHLTNPRGARMECLIPHRPPQQGGLNQASPCRLQDGTHWPISTNIKVEGGKRTWTVIWGHTTG